MLLSFLAGVACVAAAAWWAGSAITTPAQIAAEASPPEPSLITAPVELTVLSVDVVVRGTISYGTTTVVNMPDPPSLPDADPIVTEVPAAGTELTEGVLVMEVSFRPVFVLKGRLPTFRDFVRGVEGADVVQLQEALARLGFYEGDVDGVFGAMTQSATSAWFSSHGYEAAGAHRGNSTISIGQEEILFVPNLPLRVDSVGVGLGDDPSTASPLLSLTDTQLTLRTALVPSDAARITAGSRVTIRDDLTGTTAGGRIVGIADGVGTDSEYPGLVAIEIAPDRDAETLAGSNVQVVITVASTGDETLVVPVSAVFSTAKGTSHVEVAESDGGTRIVSVELGLNSRGLVEIVPIEGQITAGDAVVVGDG